MSETVQRKRDVVSEEQVLLRFVLRAAGGGEKVCPTYLEVAQPELLTYVSPTRMKIKRLPNVLALHLKRFKYQEESGRNTKLAYRVAFPLELRLFNTVDDAQDPDRLYELFAIVVHIGKSVHILL